MANDMQWPSEDEDFDAKTDSANLKSFNEQTEQPDRPQKPAAKPAKKQFNKVSVAVTEPNAHQSEEADPEIEEAFAKPVQSRDHIDQPDQPAEPEPQGQQTEEPTEPEAPVVVNGAPEVISQTESEPPVNRYQSFVGNGTLKSSASMLRTMLEVTLIVGLVAVGVYAHNLHSDNQELSGKVATLSADPQIAIKKQTDQLISNVSALMNLPAGETPTIANVSDATKAKQQSSFFANAQNGDKVLMYVKAGEAILYRPSTNKIVLVAPLTFNSDNATTKSTTPAATTPSKTTTPATNTGR